jgi:hypothetical protein
LFWSITLIGWRADAGIPCDNAVADKVTKTLPAWIQFLGAWSGENPLSDAKKTAFRGGYRPKSWLKVG